MNNKCIKHGRDIKTQHIGSTSTLLLRKTPLLRTTIVATCSALIRSTCHLGLHQRSPWNTNGKENWVQNMLNDQKLSNHPEVSKRTNQFQTQVVIDRCNTLFEPIDRCNPLLKQTHKMCQMVAKHVLVMKAKHSTLEAKHFVKERTNPLLIMTIQVMSKQCWTRWTWTSEFQGYHILLWSMRRAQAFENWFRKLRTTQTDMLFNKICDKTKPTTRSVECQNGWFRTWATLNCLNCSRRTPKRSAKHAYHTGVKASSIANAGISWKKECPIEVSLNTHWTFFSRIRHQEGKTSRPQIWENSRKNNVVHNLKKRCIKKNFKGIHDHFLRDHIFRGRMIEKSRWRSLSCMERSCRWRSHLSYVSISREMTPNNWVWFQTSVVNIKTFTPRSWRRPTRAHSLLEV